MTRFLTNISTIRLNPISLIALLLLLSAVGYGLFELNISGSDLSDEDTESMIRESLDLSVELFQGLHDQFESNHHSLRQEIVNSFETGASRQGIHELMRDYPSFWGTSLYRNEELYSWNGYIPVRDQQPVSIPFDSLSITLERVRNVILLQAVESFQLGDEEQFTLVSTRKIEQRNVIPIARNQELNLSNHPSLRDRFPVQFSFFDQPPAPPDFYRKLSTQHSDSAGIVYADPDSMERVLNQQQAQSDRWRIFFLTAIATLSILMFLLWTLSYHTWAGLILRVSGIIIAWIFVSEINLTSVWLPRFYPSSSADELRSLSAIFDYSIHSLFLFILAISVITTLANKWRVVPHNKHYLTFFYAILFGALNAGLLCFYIVQTYNTSTLSGISFLDLELLPTLSAWGFYIASAFFLCSVSALLIATWWFLFIAESEKMAIIITLTLVSYIFFIFLSDYFIVYSLFSGWIFLLATGLFICCLAGALFIYYFPESFLQLSGFRLLLIATIYSAASGYTIFSNATYHLIDRELTEVAGEYIEEQDEEASQVLHQLLTSIEQRLLFLSQNDIDNRTTLVQGLFQRAIQASMQNQWRRYSYDIQILDSNGNSISEYATNLDSPSGYFDLRQMEVSYEVERIRRETNRPIIHDTRPNRLTQGDYTTFFRGWIPVYDELQTDRIIAWIVAAIYLERPDFRKPIRAVLAASTSDDWKRSFYLSEFQDGIHTRSLVSGIYSKQPRYNQLPQREQEIALQDSIAFITNITEDGMFREVLLHTDSTTIIKASTPLPEANHQLFSIFRIQILSLLTGLLLFPLFSYAGLQMFSLFSQSRKFRHRLLDGLTLSTLLFLVVLVLSTRYAMTNQNEKNLELETSAKLDNLIETLPLRQLPETELQTEPVSLSSATTPLDTDAIFYVGNRVSESTTPQIFQQNLLPDILPYRVYDYLYNRQRQQMSESIQIGNETLLVSYRVIISEENEPYAVLAIPTFLHSPLYTEQMLETTSALLVIYLFVFGIFLTGTFIFSQQLTKPLQYIQSGLQKISSGNLETTIPVNSRDEIGSLSEAYNTMVKRLRDLRNELAIAEREAAWKEMAQQVAHEIKNPLTPMKLNLQLLQRQLENSPKSVEEMRSQIERVTENIIEQIESLNKIASDFSKFGKPVQGEFKDVEINELIRTVIEFYEADSPELFQRDLHPSPLYVSGSVDELRRTLINLVKNSIEALDGEGELIIRSGRTGTDVRIELTDNGSGIAPEDQEKIFVPNFSTKSSGTGLGLAISKKIIEAHHGKIFFRSEKGMGTTFVIELPLKE
ncbi:MAG: ATP-binding protein [Balneolaceae bacterium]